MNTKHNRENGQILVIFVIALTALLALTALAIDGGLIFSDRRYSQSVADTASMAGAGSAAQYLEKNGVTWTSFSCTNPRVMTSFIVAYDAARTRAVNNRILDLDNDLSDKHGIKITCVNDPSHFEKYIDVQTMVTTTVSTSFLHLFYPNPVKNSVNAVTRIHPRTEFAFGQAIVSLSDQCGTNDGGIVFDGTSDVYIQGGGVFSNSCIDASGNVHVGVNDGGIQYVGDITENGNPVLVPAPSQSPVTMPKQDPGTPNCGSGTATSSTGGGTINPGNYSQIKLTNGSLTMTPGLYCLTGDMSLNGGTVLGDGVTIYMKKDGGSDTSLTINGNVESHLNAPINNPENGAMIGILIYMAEGNEGTIDLQGTAASSFTGLVYAPDGSLSIGGTGNFNEPNPTYNTQLVGKYVKVHGTARIDILFNTFPPPTTEPNLDVME